MSTSASKIAILPFTNATGDPTHAYLANTFTTELVLATAQFKQLMVISRASTARAKAASDNVRNLGQEISVQYILQGNVRQTDTHPQVSVGFSDTQTENVVWAKYYVQPLDLSDGFEAAILVTGQIARSFAKQLFTSISLNHMTALSRAAYQSVF